MLLVLGAPTPTPKPQEIVLFSENSIKLVPKNNFYFGENFDVSNIVVESNNIWNTSSGTSGNLTTPTNNSQVTLAGSNFGDADPFDGVAFDVKESSTSVSSGKTITATPKFSGQAMLSQKIN